MLPVLVDDDAAVRRAEDRLAVRTEAPAGHGVERHEAGAHADRLGGRGGERDERDDSEEE